MRTLEHWRHQPQDRRRGARSAPHNRFSEAERTRALAVLCSPEYRDLSPRQVVPRLADRGEWIGSEATCYRLLRSADALRHRGRAKPPTASKPREHAATGPRQVWSWDITYLRTSVRGCFFYLYLVLDVWSRKVVGAAVHEEESGEHSAKLLAAAAACEGVRENALVIHSDNGGPMKASTLLVTLQALQIAVSFSRPSVSNDNAYSEALFRTLKYRPEYPRRPFETLEEARTWVVGFVRWYNEEHLHGGVGYVTPTCRHEGHDAALLERRRVAYETARAAHPERWSCDVRSCEHVTIVRLNPETAETAA